MCIHSTYYYVTGFAKTDRIVTRTDHEIKFIALHCCYTHPLATKLGLVINLYY